MKKFAMLFAMLVMISLPFVSNPDAFAQETPKKGGTLNVGLNTDIVSTDPHSSVAEIDSLVLHHVVEPLIAHGYNFDILPALAEKWEHSPDYKTYTFYLQKGKLFHNGREMVADDVKYSIERIMKVIAYREWFQNVDRVEVVDKYTVRLHMKKSDVSVIYALGGIHPVCGIVPKEEVDKQGGKITHPIGTGPFKFVEWKPGQYVLLERFDQYKSLPGPANGFAGGRIAYLDKVKFIPIIEESASMMALLNKEIDFLLYTPLKDVEKIRKDYSKQGMVLDSVLGQSWSMIFFSCRQPFTKDVRFRRACAYAIDPEVVIQAAARGYGVVNPSFVGTANQYYTPAHKKWYKKDINKAKQLLQEVGYKGEEIDILTSKKYPPFYNIAVAVQSELAAAGVKAKLNVVEWAIHLQKTVTAQYHIDCMGIGPRPDPTIAYGYLGFSGFFEQYPRMKEIMNEASQTMDLNERKKLFEEAHALTYEGVPGINFGHGIGNNAYWDYVKGYKIWIHMGRFWGVWLNK